ncbi:MAG: hypothetical protein QM817_11195 [Archangium sp.]
MRIWLCSVLALLSGCIVPRSMVTGQMAAPVGRGATDIGVYTGVQYAQQTNPAYIGQDAVTGDPNSIALRSTGFSMPAFEANLQYGFNDHVGLNVHASSAGIQPGVKLTVNKSKVAHFALLPQVAFGYASTGSTSLVAGPDGVQVPTSPTSGTSFTFLGGLKLLVSAKFNKTAAFFAGAGYDFIFNRNFNSQLLGTGNSTDAASTINSTTAHQISVSVGIDIALGWVHLRPEVALGFYPGIAQSRTVNNPPDSNTVAATGGFGWAIFPGFTLAVQTPQRELTAEEEEEEAENAKEEARKKRKKNGEDDDEDDDEDGNRDDEDERPKSKLKKKRQLDDDEEEDNAKKKRRPIDADDED